MADSIVINFEVVSISNIHNRGEFIFARLLDTDVDFEIEDGTTLGGIPVCNYIEMPRLLDANNQPGLDVFVFRPLEPFQEVNLVQGQQVELVVPAADQDL